MEVVIIMGLFDKFKKKNIKSTPEEIKEKNYMIYIKGGKKNLEILLLCSKKM